MTASDLGIIAVIGVVLLIAGIACYQYRRQQRSMSSGRLIGHYIAERTDDSFYFNCKVAVTEGMKWCRLILDIKSESSFEYRSLLFKEIKIAVGVPFTVSISDAKGDKLYDDKGTLAPFISWLAGRGGSSESFFKESGKGSQYGTFTLLEFLPSVAGNYEISLRMDAYNRTSTDISQSLWELREAEIKIMEDITPLSRTIKYPHKRIRL
jgi:hypothetical protein